MANLLSGCRRQLLALLCLLILPVASVLAAPPDTYKFLSLTDAMQQSSAQNKPLFLYFGRYGCSTCRKMHKEVFSDALMQEKYNNDLVLAYVDTESGQRIKLPSGERMTEMQFAARNRILGTPTFIYFSREQKPLFKKAGLQSIEQMNAYSDYVSGGHYQSKTLQQYQAAK